MVDREINGMDADILKDRRLRGGRRAIIKGMMALGATGASLAAFAQSLAAAESDDVRQLVFLSQPGVVPDILRDVTLPMFKKDYPAVDIQFEVSINAVSYPRMLAQRNNPVIAGGMMADLYTAKGVNDEMWNKLNPDFVPNIKNIPAALMPRSGLGAPLHLTPIGIMYNPDRVEEPTSWLDLFNPKYKGRVSLWDTWQDAFAAVAKASGMEPTIENGIKAWEPHKANIGSWTNNTTTEEDLVSRGEMWLAPHWGAWAEQAKAQGKRVAFTVPKEGGVQWTAYIQSTVGFSPRATELAQRYLNTWLSDACQTAWIERGFFSPSVTTVAVPASMAGNKAIMPPDQAIDRLIRLDYTALSTQAPRNMVQIARTLKS